MPESYRIAVSFVADAYPTMPMIDAIAAGFDRLSTAQRAVQTNFKQMTAALSASHELAARMAENMERVARAAHDAAGAHSRATSSGSATHNRENGGGGNGGGHPPTHGNAASGPEEPSKSPKNSTKDSDRQAPEKSDDQKSRADFLSSLSLAAAKQAWTFGKASFGEAATFDQTLDALAGDQTADIPGLRNIAFQSMRDNPYLGAADSAQIVSASYNLSDHKMAAVPGIAALLSRVDRAEVLMGKSRSDALTDATAFVQTMSGLNQLVDPKTGQFDPTIANHNADDMLGMFFANQQSRTGANFSIFSDKAGTAAGDLSEDGLFQMTRLIDSNPKTTGQELKAFEHYFLGNAGSLPPKERAYFQSLGLIGSDGRFVDSATIKSDPLKWIKDHFGRFLDDPSQHDAFIGHIKDLKINDLVQEADGTQSALNQTAMAARQTSAAQAMTALEGGGKAAQTRTQVAFENFEFAIGRFAQGPAIEVLDSLTGALNRASAYVQAHPDDMRILAQQAADFAKILIGLGVIIGKIASIVPNWLWPVLLGAGTGLTVGGPMGALIGGGAGLIFSSYESFYKHPGSPPQSPTGYQQPSQIALTGYGQPGPVRMAASVKPSPIPLTHSQPPSAIHPTDTPPPHPTDPADPAQAPRASPLHLLEYDRPPPIMLTTYLQLDSKVIDKVVQHFFDERAAFSDRARSVRPDSLEHAPSPRH